MSVPIVPGWGDVVNQFAQQAGPAIASLIQPYKQTELQLKDLISKNPELAQRFADEEFNNPGSLAPLFGPNASSYFRGLQPSAGAEINKAIAPERKAALANPETRKFIAGKQIGALPSEVSGEKYRNMTFEELNKLLTQNPELKNDVIFKQAYGTSKAEYSIQKQQEEALPVANSIVTKLAEQGKGFTDIVNSIINGDNSSGLTPKDINALMLTPQYGPTIKLLVDVQLAKMAEQNRLDIAKANSPSQLGSAIFRTKLASMLSLSGKLGIDPAAVAGAQLGLDDPVTMALGGDPNNPDFITRVEKARSLVGQVANTRDLDSLRKLRSNLDADVKNVNALVNAGADPSVIAQQVDRLNDDLASASKITGNVVTAKYVLDPERWWAGSFTDKMRSKGLYFFDDRGNYLGNKDYSTESIVTPKEPPPLPPGVGTDSTAVIGTRSAINDFVAQFPGGNSEEIKTQLEAIANSPDQELRKSTYQAFIQQVPNATDEQKKQLQTILKVSGNQ